VSALSPARADGPVHAVYARTDTPAAEDRVRTMAAVTLPGAITSTRTDQIDLDTHQLRELDQGLRLALLFVLAVAAGSLAVAAAAGITERRRPFALLRATGVRAAELRATVVLETAAPLAMTLLVGVVLGVAAGAAIAQASGQPWRPPGLDFLITLAVELGLAVVLTTVPLPLVDRLTGKETIRYD
jgi:predicted lysophospholipase L1 biosynthesis ABC-type transport system permease subunit